MITLADYTQEQVDALSHGEIADRLRVYEHPLLTSAADSIDYLAAQEGLLEQAQLASERARAALEEHKRPLDEPMARLNRRVIELTAELDALRLGLPGLKLVPVDAPPSLAPHLTSYSLDDIGMSERDRDVVRDRLQKRWAAILAALDDDGARDTHRILQGRNSQHVLKAEGESPEATDRENCVNASPDGGPMGVGQAAAAAPAGGPIWTPVSEQLPDADLSVLIATDTSVHHEPVWVGYFDGETWREVNGEPAFVTHWMPFPDPPNSDAAQGVRNSPNKGARSPTTSGLEASRGSEQ